MRERVRFLGRASPLIVDAWAAERTKGRLPASADNIDMVLQPVDARYERGATASASGRGFGGRDRVFGDSAAAASLPDRLPRHATAVRTEGSGRRSRQRAGLAPEAMRAQSATATAPPKRCSRPPKAEAPHPTIG